MKIKRSEFVEKWLEALESGKYKQARGVLRLVDGKGNVRGYCCLGVACDVAKKLGLRKKSYFEDSNNSILPEGLARFMGIEYAGDFKEPVLHGVTKYQSLTGLNDNGVRFKTIAKIIREQLAKKNFERV